MPAANRHDRPDRLGPVVCGVEDAAAGRAALTVAERLAAALDTSLVLVHVAPLPLVPDRPAATLAERTATRVAVERAGLLQVVLAPLDVAPGVAVERLVELGDPAEQLRGLAEERRAALVVVGSRGHGALSRALAGSTSGELARSAPCPVCVVPPDAVRAPASTAALVCGVDGSPAAGRAVEVAARLASRLAAELVLVEAGDAAGGAREDALRLAGEAAPQVRARYERVPGRPAGALLEAARRSSADLVVVGSRGRGGMRAALLGSVSTELMATADRPVLVVSDGAAVPA